MSVFSEHFRTNYVPFESERVEIEQRIVELKDSSLKLRSSMSSLQSTLTYMKKRKEALQAALDNHRRLLTKFRTLPDDILVVIFLLCLPDSHNATMDTNEPPLVLGRVCRRWRLVAYNSPCLWTTLHVPLPYYPVIPLDASGYGESEKTKTTMLEYNRRSSLLQAAVKKWLFRTGLSPLSISLDLTFPAVGQIHAHHLPFLDLLLPYFHRLQALDITLRVSELSSFFAKITADDVPMLEKLRISFFDHWIPPYTRPDQWNVSGLLQARNLQTVDVSFFPFSPLPFLDRWSRLTCLKLTYYTHPWHSRGLTLSDAYAILSRCSNLTQCSLEVEDSLSSKSPSAPVHLPFLESLYIVDKAPTLVGLLDTLVIPNLKYVRYHTNFRQAQGRRSPLLKLLASSSIPIERLAANLILLNLSELMECFRLTPSLTHFRQEHYSSGHTSPNITFSETLPIDLLKAAFEFLIPDQDGNCFWKRLTNLTIVDLSRITDHDVVRFIGRRHNISTASGDIAVLKDITVNIYHPMLDNIQQKLSLFTEKINGLKLVVKYPLAINYKGYFKRIPSLQKGPQNPSQDRRLGR